MINNMDFAGFVEEMCMLEVKLCGGLGNQMFQYAFCLYLRSAQNKVRLNISDYRVHRHHQGFELERVFGIKEDYNREKSDWGINTNIWHIRLIQKLFRIEIVSRSECHEVIAVTNVPYKKICQNLFMVGYWQDYLYIEPIERELRRRFQFPSLTGKNEEFYCKMKERETVAIHVRRGDYLKIGGMGSICNYEYYKKAIRYMMEKIEQPTFIFFSDDPEWCKEKFKNLEAWFVDWNKGENSYKDMQLMSLCKHNIIANSTFSWWGAWLNSSDEKLVVAPERWWPQIEENTLCGKQWVLI